VEEEKDAKKEKEEALPETESQELNLFFYWFKYCSKQPAKSQLVLQL